MNQDLNDVLIFAKVVEQGSFTAAARILDIPKTTVSRKVQMLEQRLGARLLNRTTRRLSLTEAGSLYYEYCNQITVQLNEAESAVHRLEDKPRGWLRVTAPFTLCTEFVSALIRDFRTLYPEVKIDLVLSNDRLDLVAHQIDVALRVGPLPDSSLVARPLARYRSYIYASKRYIARYGEPKEPSELIHHHALAKSSDLRNQRYTWLLQNGQRREEAPITPIAVANDPFALQELFVDGQGLMLASEVVACWGARETELRRILEDWSGPEVELAAVFPGGQLVSPKVRTFVDFVAERLRLENLPPDKHRQPEPQPEIAEEEEIPA